MSEDAKNELPPGWVRTSVCDVFRVVGGGTPSTTRPEFWDGAIPWITSADIDDQHHVTPRRAITEAAIADSATNLVPPNSVVVVTRVGLGKVGLATEALCFSQDSQALLFDPQVIDPWYIIFYMGQAVSVFRHIGRGTTISGVTKRQLLDLSFSLPPFPEQRRIVAEIEKHFSRLEAAVAALRRVAANLKRYRASVLKAACEGRLVTTEAELARAEGRDYEPADKLLARILKERRARWEADQLAKMQAAGQAPKDDEWKAKFKEPTPRETGDLPNLPEGWVWSTWEQLSVRVTVGHVGPMKHEYVEDGIPFLRSQNVRENRFDSTGLLHIGPAFHARLSKSILRSGDLAVVRSGSVGVSCVVPDSLGEANCADLVIVSRPLGINPQYGSYYMNSLAKGRISAGKVGIALSHFNTKSVEALPVPLSPAPEQERIVAEGERRLSVIDELETLVEANLKRAGRLRQAILKRAFESKLVPQDPSDEPASVWLERIRAERATRQPADKPVLKRTSKRRRAVPGEVGSLFQ